MFSQSEIEQYRRHLSLEGFGQPAQEKLARSSVLVIGAGGLGCPALQYLTAAGVGKIGIIDDDLVELSNLQRQILFTHEDVGKPKAEVASQALSKLNPHIKIISYRERFSQKNAERLLDEYQMVLDGTDNFSSRYLINDACVLFNTVLIHGSINRFEGMVSVFNFQNGPTYRCMFPDCPDPSTVPTCAEAGVIGVLPGLIGCWQAWEAIKVLTGVGEPLSGKVLLYDSLSQTMKKVALKPLPQSRQISSLPELSPSCSQQNTMNPENKIEELSIEELEQMMAMDTSLQILDVREDWERNLDKISPSHHIPLGNLMESVSQSYPIELSKEQNLVVYCKAGVRSRMACQALQTIGFKNLYNLSQGMDGWLHLHQSLSESE